MYGNDSGFIFNIQRFVLHDGPGIRTTVFFKGCPLNCSWCHNPEGISPEIELLYKRSQCILTGDCVELCNNNALTIEYESLVINREMCNLCGQCITACKTNALEFAGQKLTVDEILREVLRDKEFYTESGGGLTISGGEPFMQFSFLKSLVIEAKSKGLHICLDTSGYVSIDKINQIIDYIDMFLYDIKTLNNEKHLRLTAVSNELIIKNLKMCLETDQKIIIRIPLVLGYNFDDLGDDFLFHFKTLANMGVKNFEVIPYHKFGELKYQMLGKHYDLNPLSLNYQELNNIVKAISLKYDIKINISTPIIT